MTFHVSDIVRLRTPNFVRRVGYSVVPSEIQEEIEINSEVDTAFRALVPGGGARAKQMFCQGLARARANASGYGGDERSLHYWASGPWQDSWKDSQVMLVHRRVVYTGTYDGRDPPELLNRKAVVLWQVWPHSFPRSLPWDPENSADLKTLRMDYDTDYVKHALWVEASSLEKIS